MSNPKRPARERHLRFLNTHATNRVRLPKGVQPVVAMNWCLKQKPDGNMLTRVYIRNIDRYAFKHNMDGEWASFGDTMWFKHVGLAVLFKLTFGGRR